MVQYTIGQALGQFLYEPYDDHTINEIKKMMQECFPGDYTMQVSQITGGLSVIFSFADSEEELVHKLKYGY